MLDQLVNTSKEMIIILAEEFSLWLSICILVIAASGGIDSIKIAYKNWINK